MTLCLVKWNNKKKKNKVGNSVCEKMGRKCQKKNERVKKIWDKSEKEFERKAKKFEKKDEKKLIYYLTMLMKYIYET